MNKLPRDLNALLGLACLVACGHGSVTPKASPSPPAPEIAAAAAPRVSPCSQPVALAELLARHAREFGSEAQVAALLPRVERGESDVNGQKDKFESLLTRTQLRTSEALGGLVVAEGIDGAGIWSLGLDGVVHRLQADEAPDVLLAHWLGTRRYLSTLDAQRDAVRCEPAENRAHVVVSTRLAELGSPELTFDLETAQLLAVRAASADGHQTMTWFEAHTPAIQGVRWPERWTEQSTNISHYQVREAQSLQACDSACIAAPPDHFTIPWPESGRLTLPMRVYRDELVVRAKVAGKEVWAMLDSGAGMSALDASRGLGEQFTPAAQILGSGASQALKVGLGELHDVTLGSITLPVLPVAHVPIPALDDFGEIRPELLVGYSLVAQAATRIDYEKNNLTFAPTADGLHSAKAVAVPLRIWDGKAMVELTIEGIPAFVQVDTGCSGGVSFFKRWTSAHGLPGDGAKLMTVHYLSGAGSEETDNVWWRSHSLRLGPLQLENVLVDIADPPSAANVAGLLGNRVLARCRAVVLDVRGRTLWFEPPCNRAMPESLAGFHLTWQVDAAFPEQPWVVTVLIPDGTAARAGVEVGDRLLSVNGKVAGADRDAVASFFERAPGTRVKLEVLRRGKREQLTATLVEILPP